MYLGVANLLGILGFKPPTKDLNVTAALALMSIVLIETAGIRVKGLKGWLKSFTEPIAIVTPINIMEVFIKPLSLCMRLFARMTVFLPHSTPPFRTCLGVVAVSV